MVPKFRRQEIGGIGKEAGDDEEDASKASTSSIALAWKVSLGTVLGDIQQC